MTDRRRTKRRDLIVAAARAGFTTDGYDGTTIGELAAGLDISKAAIAYYFPTKETFLDEFVAPFLDELEAAVADGDGPPEVILAYLSTLMRHRDIAVWIDTDQVLQNHPVFGKRLSAINERTIAVITRGSAEPMERIKALGVLGGLWRPVRELSTAELDAHRDEIVEAALAGF